MNLFEFFVNLNHRSHAGSWVEATAVFTGKRNQVSVRSKSGYHTQEYYEYEILYRTEEKEQRAWYTFYPLPDPEVDAVQGEKIRIRYNRRKPYIFESVS